MISTSQSLSKSKRLLSVNDCTTKDIKEIFDISSENNFNKKLSGQIITVFFENSTRTLLSFEKSALNLGLSCIRFDASSSSIAKEETEINTMRTLNSLSAACMILRCKNTGETELFSKYINPEIGIINAGDGTGEHPTQALLDFFTIIKNFNIKFSQNCLSGFKIAIAGDILNSRVARSNIFLLSQFGAEIEIISPPNFLPENFANYYIKTFNCKVSTNLKHLKADVIMLLRTQKERMTASGKIVFPSNFGIFTEQDLNGAMLMHPGPVNEGAEVSKFLAYQSKKSLISKQVENGVKVRTAVLRYILQ